MKQVSLRGFAFYLSCSAIALAFATPSRAVVLGSTPVPANDSATPTPTATPNPILTVSCVDDSGALKNVADPTSVCKSTLPKCSDLYASTQTNVKSLLSWKIWGYYNGKDIDLSTSNVSALVGKTMANQVCSVVGQRLQVAGGVPDAEISVQTIGLKKTCGLLPSVTAKTGGKKLYLSYQNGAGSLWVSYMLGTYPWLIRKVTADVFAELKPDFSNIATVISNQAMSADVIATTNQMNILTAALSATEKANCDTSSQDIATKCSSGGVSIGDPAQRVCTIAKARVTSNQGAIPNLLVFEIMTRAQKQYDATFSGVLSRANSNFDTFADSCDNASTGFFHGAKHKIACAASCFFGGDLWASDGNTVAPGDSIGPSCTHPELIAIGNDNLGGFFGGAGMISSGDNSNVIYTYNKGFAAYIEWVIRHQICGQNKRSDKSVCDDVNIPSQPAAVTATVTPTATPVTISPTSAKGAAAE